MQPVIIADASCLVLLEKIDYLNILKDLYGQILITQIIADEFGLQIPDWILIRNPKNISQQRVFEHTVDCGEASAIALAIENEDSLLIMDDLPGRKLAKQLKINITGTLGIIADAKLTGIIPSVKPILERIQQTDFRISNVLINYIISKANE
jgi:predicted nucleic acid-binding protein